MWTGSKVWQIYRNTCKTCNSWFKICEGWRGVGERATEAEKRGTERVMGTKDESGRQFLQTLTRKLCHKQRKKDDLSYNRKYSPKVGTTNFNTESPKTCLTVQNTHSCLFFSFPNKCLLLTKISSSHESWVKYSKSVKKNWQSWSQATYALQLPRFKLFKWPPSL